MTKIFVTGATGFIGAHLCEILDSKGFEIVALKRVTSKSKLLNSYNVTFIDGDLLDKESIRNGMKNCEAVFHLGAMISYFRKDAAMQKKINVDGTKNVVEAAIELGIKKFVHVSSVAALGYDKHGGIANEMIPYNWPEGIIYNETKRDSENIVKHAVSSGKLNAVIVNPTAVQGDRDIYKISTNDLLYQLSKGRIPGYIAGGATHADVKDVALGIWLAFEKGRVGENYILGGEHYHHYDFLKMVCDVSGFSFNERKIPHTVIRIAEKIFLAMEMLGKKPPIASWMCWLSRREIYHSSQKAIDELGYKISPMNTCIERAVLWSKEMNLIRFLK